MVAEFSLQEMQMLELELIYRDDGFANFLLTSVLHSGITEKTNPSYVSLGKLN